MQNEKLKIAEQILIDNGIEPDEAPVVLQRLGYALLDTELYPVSLDDVVQNAIQAAKRDWYDQVVYQDGPESWAFIRDYPRNGVNPQNIVGFVRTDYRDGLMYANYQKLQKA